MSNRPRVQRPAFPQDPESISSMTSIRLEYERVHCRNSQLLPTRSERAVGACRHRLTEPLDACRAGRWTAGHWLRIGPLASPSRGCGRRGRGGVLGQFCGSANPDGDRRHPDVPRWIRVRARHLARGTSQAHDRWADFDCSSPNDRQHNDDHHGNPVHDVFFDHDLVIYDDLGELVDHVAGQPDSPRGHGSAHHGGDWVWVWR